MKKLMLEFIYINDLVIMSTSKEKTNTGKEKTPKGLGHLAEDHPENKIMVGKDGRYYYVKQYKNGKRWKAFGEMEELLDKIPDNLYVDAYKPKVKKIDITKETGRESKFGGNRPFFVQGEQWPSDKKYDYKSNKYTDTYYMTFFCQFIDPRKNDNMLYRVFILLDDGDICEKHWITKIELNEENLKNQVIIEKPKYPEGYFDKYTREEIFDPYEITGWTKFSEFLEFQTIRKHFDIKPYKYGEDNTIYNELHRAYFDHSYSPSSGVKVGGTPLSTQDQDYVQAFNLLQLEATSYLPYMWGDCGIAHVSEDLDFTWDCC